MASEALHVPEARLSKTARLLHYALSSLMEELEAVDWYRQRADDTEDDELKQVLLHNMREEMEHACMLIEWMRRNNKDFSGHIDTYLYSEGPLLEVEAKADGGGGGPKPKRASFTVGRMKQED
jgi:ferritin-like protein